MLSIIQDTDCQLKRYGGSNDGGYLLCKNILQDSVALINIGVQLEDKFGCQLTTEFPMPNYQYSCTVPNYQSKCSTNGGISYFAHNICAHENLQQQGTWYFYTFEDILKSRGLHKRPITLRLNEFEDKVLKNLAIEFTEYFDQLVIDLHFSAGSDLWGHLDIIKSLNKEMIPVNVHSSNGACFEGAEKGKRKLPSGDIQVTYVNKKKVKINSQARSFTEHSLNAPNYP